MVGGGIPALLVARRGQLRARGRGRLLVDHAGCLSRCLPSRERDSRLGVMTAECSASRAGMSAKFADGRRLSCLWMARWLCSIEGWAGTRKSRSGPASHPPGHGDAGVQWDGRSGGRWWAGGCQALTQRSRGREAWTSTLSVSRQPRAAPSFLWGVMDDNWPTRSRPHPSSLLFPCILL